MKKNTSTSVLSYFMRKLDIPVTQIGISDELLKHPTPNELTAVGDVLNNWKVPNQINQLPVNELQGVKPPFIVGFSDNTLAVVSALNDDYATVNNGQGKNQILNIKDFKRQYKGTILTAEKSPRSGEEGYSQKRRKEIVEELRNPVFAAGGGLILLIFLFLNGYLNAINLQTALLILFKLGGLVTSIFLLLQNIDASNPLIQKICGSDVKKNCNAILTSKAAKINDELSWSEIGFFYFAGTLLVLLFGGRHDSLLLLLALLNICCLPYTFYSIYYQWRIAKQWCVLCCTVQGLLWLEFFAFLPLLFHGLQWPDLVEWGNFLAAMATPILLWIFFKPYLRLTIQVPTIRQQLNSFKYNKTSFQKILEGGGKYELLSSKETLVFGGRDAKHTITMVSNPYCGHCARVHKILDKWLSKRKDIKLQVVFSTGNDNTRKVVAAQLMSIRQSKGRIMAKRALNAWYLQPRKNYAVWAKKYIAVKSPEADAAVEKQNKWCREAYITGTPTLFINGYKLPKVYQVDDIKYLL